MYCIPPNVEHPFLCSNTREVLEYWQYIEKYKDVFRPFAEYYALAEYIKKDTNVVVPELPITLKEYPNPRYFYDAIACKITYDIMSTKPVLEYWSSPTRFSSRKEGDVKLTVYPDQIPGVAIPTVVDSIIRSLKEGIKNAEFLGAKLEQEVH